MSDKLFAWKGEKYNDFQLVSSEVKEGVMYPPTSDAVAKSNNTINSDIDELVATTNALNQNIIVENLIPFPYADGMSKTISGITWTVNEDGSVTANGTATARNYFILHNRAVEDNNDLIIPNGTYHLSGCPSGGSSSSYSLESGRTYNGLFVRLGNDYGDGVDIIANGDDYSTDSVNLQVVLSIAEGYTADNLTFYPMLEKGTIAHNYVPYKQSRVSLRNDVDELAKTTNAINQNLSSLLRIDTFRLTCPTDNISDYSSSVSVALDGYTVIGVVGYQAIGNSSCYLYDAKVFDNNLHFGWRDPNGLNIKGLGFEISVLYVKNL